MRGPKKDSGKINHDTTYREDGISSDISKNWFDNLNPEDVIDLLPNMSNSRGQHERIQIPVHSSTILIATKIREQNPTKFRINLDVLKSMLYAGRQLFDLAYLKNKKANSSRGYQMAKLMEEIEHEIYDDVWVDNMLEKYMEGYLSLGQGKFSRDKIIEKIEQMKLLLSPELQEKCDNFIIEELDAESTKARIKERIRKREYRKRSKNIALVR